MRRSDSSRKWKYAKHAKKRRICERCYKRLRRDEVKLCKECFVELLGGEMPEEAL